MKKKNLTLSPSRTDNQIDIIGLHVNISRIYEVSKVGEHSIAFCYFSDKDDPERTVNPKDIKMIADYYSIQPIQDGDILCEVVRPDFDSIKQSMTRKFETLDEINARVKQAKDFPLPLINTMNDVCYSLLGTAYDRLNLAVYHIPMIQKIAQSIARLAMSEQIRVEHIVEAIQYRALLDDEKVKIYQP